MAPPRKKNPRTEFVTLRLTQTEAADLDTLAQTQGLSRSQAVRAAVSRVIAAEQRKTIRTAKSPAVKNPQNAQIRGA